MYLIALGETAVVVNLHFFPMSDNTDEILLVASENYREGKELFAINVYGCSISDILLTIMIMPFLFSIYHELCKIIRRSNVRVCFELLMSSFMQTPRNMLS